MSALDLKAIAFSTLSENVKGINKFLFEEGKTFLLQRNNITYEWQVVFRLCVFGHGHTSLSSTGPILHPMHTDHDQYMFDIARSYVLRFVNTEAVLYVRNFHENTSYVGMVNVCCDKKDTSPTSNNIVANPVHNVCLNLEKSVHRFDIDRRLLVLHLV